MIEVRQHGRWRLLDWLWLGLFVNAMRVFPKWRRRYLAGYVTVSVLTRTVYTPDGTLGSRSRRHEVHHIHQAERDGTVKFCARYLLSQRWRVRYEAEAYRAAGSSYEDAVAHIQEGYLVWLSPLKVAAIVAEEYA